MTANNTTTVQRKSERELVVTRTFAAPARLVFEAWTTPTLMTRWWVPKSCGMTLLSCDMDVRPGGSYRFEFGHPASEGPMAFFGKYVEVIANERLVWTNEESAEGAVTTVAFDEVGGETRLTLSEAYPSKAALDATIEGTEGGMPEQFLQLDSLLAELAH